MVKSKAIAGLQPGDRVSTVVENLNGTNWQVSATWNGQTTALTVCAPFSSAPHAPAIDQLRVAAGGHEQGRSSGQVGSGLGRDEGRDLLGDLV